MIALGYYILKVFICSAILFLYYHLALRNKVFHQWNRFYLLAAVVLSLVLPCLHINIGATDEGNKAIHLLRVVTAADEYVVDAAQSNTLSTSQWIGVLYTVICCWLTIMLLLSLIKIYQIIRSGYSLPIHNIRLIDSEAKGTPFSFLHFIIWNRKINLHSEAGQLVFKHELVHVQEKHTLDKLFLQTVLIFFWCNPVFWLIRKELGMIHEFIADQKAVEQQGTEAFAAMILQAAYPQQYTHLTHSFFQSPIKRRLAMLTKIQNPKISYASRILALPLLAFIGLAFTLKTHSNSNYVLDKKITVVIDAGHGGNQGPMANNIYEDELNLAIAQKIKEVNNNDNINIVLTRNNNESLSLQDRVKMAAGNKADLFISVHINASDKPDSSGMTVLIPKDNTPYIQQSKVLSSLIVQNLSGVYYTNPFLGQRSTGIWVLDHNICPAVLVELGYMTNAKDLAFIRQPTNQQAIAEKILSAIAQYSVSENNGFSNIQSDTTPQKKNTVIKDVRLENIQNNDRTATNEVRNENNIEVKDVRLENTQRSASDTTPNNNGKQKFQGLYILDGEIYKGDIKDIEPNSIESINVLKGESATKKYGEKGKNGVIEITTKKSGLPTKKVSASILDNNKVFTQVEKDAHFPSGQEGWRHYLIKNLDASVPVKNGAPQGTYTVQVQFIVHPDGYLSDIKTLTHNGYGMEEAVLQLIKQGPKWIPAEQNGHAVTSITKQPVTFVVRK